MHTMGPAPSSHSETDCSLQHTVSDFQQMLVSQKALQDLDKTCLAAAICMLCLITITIDSLKAPPEAVLYRPVWKAYDAHLLAINHRKKGI